MTRTRPFDRAVESVAPGEDELVRYQPLVELATGRIVGVEAVARPNADHGAAFDTACRRVHGWQARHGLQLDLSVTVSARQLDQAGFADYVGGMLWRTQFDPRRLVLDVVASALPDPGNPSEPSSSAARSISALRCSGVRIALADFGSRHVPTGQLRWLPVDILKVDQSVVSADHPGRTGEARLDAIVGVARTLGLDLVARGIETTGQLTRLQGLDCPVGQGPLLSRPVSAAVVDTMLRHSGSVPPELYDARPAARTA